MTLLNGYEIAERLGLEAFHHESGDFGSVYFLDDGRVMKLCDERDAALALALLDLADKGERHDSVPRIDQVLAFEDIADLGEIEMTYRRYAVLREAFDDPMDDLFAGLEWREALSLFNRGWSTDAPDLVGMALQKWAPFGPELKQIHTGLDWIKSRLGVTVFDVRPPNVGQSAAGVFGQRDLGKSNINETMVAAVRDMPLTRFDETMSNRFSFTI